MGNWRKFPKGNWRKFPKGNWRKFPMGIGGNSQSPRDIGGNSQDRSSSLCRAPVPQLPLEVPFVGSPYKRKSFGDAARLGNFGFRSNFTQISLSACWEVMNSKGSSKQCLQKSQCMQRERSISLPARGLAGGTEPLLPSPVQRGFASTFGVQIKPVPCLGPGLIKVMRAGDRLLV